MKAAVLHEVNKPLVIEDVSLQKPGPREVLIRTSVAGLCHSDLHFMEGLYPHPLPAVLGHESAGVVEQVGSDVSYVSPGDHVVTCLSVFCGTGAVHRYHGEDAAGRVQPAILGAIGKAEPVSQSLVIRRTDVGA
jgi:S-(hydroxymethyl)glutathione dehydrogenase/alcohol dehydrogenase